MPSSSFRFDERKAVVAFLRDENHRIPSSVHTFFDQVLLSLHRRYPLASVSLTSR
jgi:hypothetical protein